MGQSALCLLPPPALMRGGERLERNTGGRRRVNIGLPHIEIQQMCIRLGQARVAGKHTLANTREFYNSSYYQAKPVIILKYSAISHELSEIPTKLPLN